MTATFKPQYINIFRRFTLLLAPGLLTLATSLILVSCTAKGQKAQTPFLLQMYLKPIHLESRPKYFAWDINQQAI
ncbi:hypothetical protein [Nostoc sp.]|uniref:hypothetical protein n=1 Tax=Nostoc sp. TaxID=1180 RepID=UPI002FFB8A35